MIAMSEIPNCFYRVSIKALILNETKDKFLICEEENGFWELPGGGLDWGMTPQEDLPREISEEMGLTVTRVADNPSYFLTDQRGDAGKWIANILFETEVEHLNFTPSDECVNIKFVNNGDIEDMNVFSNVSKFAEMFKSENHQ